MSELPAGFDRWLTSPPEPDPAGCVECGERAYDRRDPDDAPFADAVDEGVVCSVACWLADRMEHLAGAERVEALRWALDEGCDLPLVQARPLADAESLVGLVVDWSPTTVTLEDGDGHEREARWDALADVEVVDA